MLTRSRRAFSILTRIKQHYNLPDTPIPSSPPSPSSNYVGVKSFDPSKSVPREFAHIKVSPINPKDFKVLLPANEPMSWSPPDARSLRVMFMGLPNSGKSSLINSIIGRHVCPVSSLSNTTREKMAAIQTNGTDQLVLVDMPSVKMDDDERMSLRPRKNVLDPWTQLRQADYVVMVLDAKSCFRSEPNLMIERDVQKMLDKFDALKVPSLLILNKSDLVPHKRTLIDVLDLFKSKYLSFDHIFPFSISSSSQSDSNPILPFLQPHFRPSYWSYPPETLTNYPPMKLIQDLTRSVIFDLGGRKDLPNYLPYKLQYELNGFTSFPDGSVRVDYEIRVHRPEQKRFIVGRNGRVLTKIIKEATKAMEGYLHRRVHLVLTVK